MLSSNESSQINQMVQFILQEAREKADEISVKTQHEYQQKRMDLIEESRNQLREAHAVRMADAELQKRIDRSVTINAARLELMNARHRAITLAKQNALQRLASVDQDTKYPELIHCLMLQALVQLREPECAVRCRESDAKLVASLIPSVVQRYTTFMSAQVGPGFHTRVTLDTGEYLPEFGSLPAIPGGSSATPGAAVGCAGGVVVSAVQGRLVVDNTLNKRLELAFENLKPKLRAAMFGKLDQERVDLAAVSQPQQGEQPEA